MNTVGTAAGHPAWGVMIDLMMQNGRMQVLQYVEVEVTVGHGFVGVTTVRESTLEMNHLLTAWISS